MFDTVIRCVKENANLPAGAVKILTRGDPGDPATAATELVTISCPFGSGDVIYSTIPWPSKWRTSDTQTAPLLEANNGYN